MEASRVDELVTRALDAQVDEYRQWREEAAALAERVGRLEAAVEALRADVAAAAREGVAGEFDRLSEDLRRQINDLGRLIVNDLGRLPKILAERPAEAQPPLDLRDDVELPYAEAGDDRRGLFRRR
jgi:hypothetical protein